jgi:hypothetical protein
MTNSTKTSSKNHNADSQGMPPPASIPPYPPAPKPWQTATKTTSKPMTTTTDQEMTPASRTSTDDNEEGWVTPKRRGAQKGGRGPRQLATINETKAPPTDSAVIGIHFTVSNKQLDIIDFVRAFIENTTADAIMNYKREPETSLTKDRLLQELASPTTKTFYEDFLGIKEEIPRSRQGDLQTPRRYGAIYMLTNRSYKEMKDDFLTRIGGRSNMQHLKWFLSEYDDNETQQKIFAVLLGKNPRRGFGLDYSRRIRKALYKSTGQEYNITAVIHNETLLKGEKIQVYGLQIGRSQSGIVEAALRKMKGKCDGLFLRFKSDKKDRVNYEKSMRNIQALPTIYTGIPMTGLDNDTATELRLLLQQHPAKYPLPLDLESTHLTATQGKYMAIVPQEKVGIIRDYLRELFTNNPTAYRSAEYPEGPTLTPPRQKETDDLSDISPDAFGDLTVAASHTDQTTAGTTLSYAERRQKVTDYLPPITPTRQDVWASIPKEIKAIPKTYEEALTGQTDEGSAGDSATWTSAISKLTEENSRLQETLQTREAEMQSLKEEFDELRSTQSTAITKAVETATARTTREVSELQNKITTLNTSLQNAKQAIEQTHSQYELLQTASNLRIDELTTKQQEAQSHYEQLQTKHELTVKELAAAQATLLLQHKHEMQQIQKDHTRSLQALQQKEKDTREQEKLQNQQELQAMFLQWTQQMPKQAHSPPISSPTIAKETKRRRQTTPPGPKKTTPPPFPAIINTTPPADAVTQAHTTADEQMIDTSPPGDAMDLLDPTSQESISVTKSDVDYLENAFSDSFTVEDVLATEPLLPTPPQIQNSLLEAATLKTSKLSIMPTDMPKEKEKQQA